MTPPDDASTGFRYPVHPGRPLVTSMPYPGDFVVLSLNPLLSVAHLDAQARKEAAALHSARYIALVKGVGQGLPLKTKPTNEYLIVPVRDTGRPASYPDDARFCLTPKIASQLALPISPYRRDGEEESCMPIVPTADFIRSECELDLAFGSLRVRVTTSRRDCSDVLSLPTSELVRLSHLQHRALEARESLVSSGGIATDFDPRPVPEIVNQQFSPIIYPRGEDCDDLESISGIFEHDSSSDMHESLDMDEALRLFSALLKHSGSKNVPVVDVQYDLSSVKHIPDPSDFMRERWELYQIVERATLRMLSGSSDSSSEESEGAMPNERLYRPHHHHADASRPGLYQVRQPAESPYVAPVRKEGYTHPVKETVVVEPDSKAYPASNKPSPHSPSNALPVTTGKASVVSRDSSGGPSKDDSIPSVNGRSRASSPSQGRKASIAGLGKGRALRESTV